jgi:hypothetical protein
LGKYINDLRRKTSDRHLASRAKNLVKKWRQLLVASTTGGVGVAGPDEQPQGSISQNSVSAEKLFG